MSKTNIAGLILSLLGILIGSSPCQAADKYPSRPITFLVAYVPGATVDITIRALAEPAQKKLGQPIVVVNKARRGWGGDDE